jgi:hypothetical protein
VERSVFLAAQGTKRLRLHLDACIPQPSIVAWNSPLPGRFLAPSMRGDHVVTQFAWLRCLAIENDDARDDKNDPHNRRQVKAFMNRIASNTATNDSERQVTGTTVRGKANTSG